MEAFILGACFLSGLGQEPAILSMLARHYVPPWTSAEPGLLESGEFQDEHIFRRLTT
jgi:hypothetical protein